MLLDATEESVIQSALGCRPIFATVVKVYISKESYWKETGLIGALAIVQDSALKSNFLRIVDLKNRLVAWEQEFYEDFKYFALRPYFHTLETDEQVVGFAFASESEAKGLYSKISMLSRATSSVNTNLALPQSSSSSLIRKATKKEKRKGGFFGKIFGKKEDLKEEFSLSGPKNFRQVSHIGWDPVSGFEVDSIPAEWKKLFQQAGIKKSELRNAETAGFVMDVVMNAIKSDANDSNDTPASKLSLPPIPLSVPKQAHTPAVRSEAPIPPAKILLNAPAPPLNSCKSQNVDLESRGDLLSQIQAGKILKPTEEHKIPDLTELDENKTTDIATILSNAMNGRRQDMHAEEESTDEEWSS